MPDDPQHVLVVSADMGEGHNATARALEEAAREQWPGCTVRRVDTLDLMGPGVGRLFRWIYVQNVETTPWLYEFFYASLWRHRWFARASKAFVGRWSGPRLRTALDREGADVVLSTYPLGSAGLAWLRRRGELPQPAGAWVSDFAPHPFWVYSELDATFVMHDLAVPLATAAETGTRVEVCPAPVTRSFREAPPPGTREAVRDRLGVPATSRVVLVSCGAYGFGTVSAAVDAALQAAPDVHVLIATGRNTSLRDELADRWDGDPRVRVLGWVDDVPGVLAASDAVVSNAGGATALEALAARRTVLMFQPIAAHGRANAELMSRAGSAQVCEEPDDLSRAVAGLDRAEGAASDAPSSDGLGVTESLVALAGRRVAPRRDVDRSAAPALPVARSLPAADAVFLDVDTPSVPQQIGTVVLLEPAPEPMTEETARAVAHAIPNVHGRLARGGWWRGPTWQPVAPNLLDPMVTSDEIGGDPSALAAEVDRFFSRPLDLHRPPARVRLLSGLDGGRQALLIQVHHALCDGVVLIRALSAEADRLRGVPEAQEPAAHGADAPTGPAPRRSARRVGRSLRGLWSLARAGAAPPGWTSAPVSGPQRRHVMTTLDAADVRRASRLHDCSTGELLIAALVEALREAGTPPADPAATMRLLVPRSLRGHGGDPGGPASGGNRTGATPVDVPAGPMPLPQRIRATRDAMRRHASSGQALAARDVLSLVGLLPPALRRPVNRLMYRSTWFSAVATVLPGLVREVDILGHRVADAFPVLPLAPGTQVAFGAIPRRRVVDVCVTLGPDLEVSTERVAARLAAVVERALDRGPGRSTGARRAPRHRPAAAPPTDVAVARSA